MIYLNKKMSLKDFLIYQAKTSPNPVGLEVNKAKGSYIFDADGKKYLDFVAGISACSLGHRHPKVIKAIKKQLNKIESKENLLMYGPINLNSKYGGVFFYGPHLIEPLIYIIDSMAIKVANVPLSKIIFALPPPLFSMVLMSE